MRHSMVYLIVIFLFIYPCCGQGVNFSHTDTIPAKVSNLIKKRPIPTILENLGTNIFINRIDADLRDLHWGKVTPKTWLKNIKGKIEPDYDRFSTNWVGHPAHASLFFNAARYNGYNYWQSIPFTIGGSLMWEYFGETYAPSEIDIATMSLGGTYIGEVTHRLSDVLWYKLENKNMFLRHTASGLLNPMAKLNSFFLKDETRPSFNNPTPSVIGELSIGTPMPVIFPRENILGSRGYINLSLIYGDIFKRGTTRYRPFDFFIFNSWLDFNIHNVHKGLYFNVLSHAPLFVKHLGDNSVLSFSQHYDYLTTNIFKLGSLAFTGDYSARLYGEKWMLTTSIKGGGIVFGSSQSEIIDYIYNSDDPEFERDYIYGAGYITEGEIYWKHNNIGKLMCNFNRWVIFPARDARGIEDVFLLNLQYQYPIYLSMNIGFQINYYKRLADYPDYEKFRNIKKNYFELKTLLSWSF